LGFQKKKKADRERLRQGRAVVDQTARGGGACVQEGPIKKGGKRRCVELAEPTGMAGREDDMVDPGMGKEEGKRRENGQGGGARAYTQNNQTKKKKDFLSFNGK